MVAVPRVVPVEMSEADLVQELQTFSEKANLGGTFLRDEADAPGAPLAKGDVVYLRDYSQTNVADGAPLYVVTTVPEASLLFCAFYDKRGNAQRQFFTDRQIARLGGRSTKAAAVAKKTSQRRR